MEMKDKLADVVRRFAGGSQREFCRATGISPSSMSRMIGGQIQVSPKVVAKIRKAYPVAADYLDGLIGLPRAKTDAETVEELRLELAALKAELDRKNRIIDAMLDKL